MFFFSIDALVLFSFNKSVSNIPVLNNLVFAVVFFGISLTLHWCMVAFFVDSDVLLLHPFNILNLRNLQGFTPSVFKADVKIPVYLFLITSEDGVLDITYYLLVLFLHNLYF